MIVPNLVQSLFFVVYLKPLKNDQKIIIDF